LGKGQAVTERIKGRMEPVGVRLFEKYEVQLDLNKKQRQEYKSDPLAFTKRFLEEQGFEVREIQLLSGDDSAEVGGAASAAEGGEESRPYYHIQYPDNERSGWICCCRD